MAAGARARLVGAVQGPPLAVLEATLGRAGGILDNLGLDRNTHCVFEGSWPRERGLFAPWTKPSGEEGVHTALRVEGGGVLERSTETLPDSPKALQHAIDAQARRRMRGMFA